MLSEFPLLSQKTLLFVTVQFSIFSMNVKHRVLLLTLKNQSSISFERELFLSETEMNYVL